MKENVVLEAAIKLRQGLTLTFATRQSIRDDAIVNVEIEEGRNYAFKVIEVEVLEDLLLATIVPNDAFRVRNRTSLHNDIRNLIGVKVLVEQDEKKIKQIKNSRNLL